MASIYVSYWMLVSRKLMLWEILIRQLGQLSDKVPIYSGFGL